MFPAYKPTDIPRLPLGLYRDLVFYYNEVRSATGMVPQTGYINDEPDVDFDKTFGIGMKRG